MPRTSTFQSAEKHFPARFALDDLFHEWCDLTLPQAGTPSL